VFAVDEGVVFNQIRLEKVKAHINQIDRKNYEMKTITGKFALRLQGSFYIKKNQRAIGEVKRFCKIGERDTMNNVTCVIQEFFKYG
jgi:hypothetical protein